MAQAFRRESAAGRLRGAFLRVRLGARARGRGASRRRRPAASLAGVSEGMLFIDPFSIFS